MKKTSFFYLFLILTFLFSSCQSTPPLPAATRAPTPPLTPTSDTLSGYLSQNVAAAPRVISSSPQAGQSLATGGEVTLVFDQAMDPVTTAKALAVVDAAQQSVTGALSWQNTHTLVFRPARPLQAGAAYRVRLGESATSAGGQPLAQPLALSFQTTGELNVSQVFPADGAVDVENKATITVMFNRPVVPLVIAEQQAGLINPLQLDPPAPGHGEWVNTSLYVFHPDGVLKGGQTYRATVKAGLVDAGGDASAALKTDIHWSFGVAAASISQVTYNDMSLASGLAYMPLAPVFKILFRQPMDPKSVEASLKLTSNWAMVPLGFSWDEKNTQVTFKSPQLLGLDTDYTLSLDVSARAADGGSLGQGMTRTFRTVGNPAIISTKPAGGETAAQTTLEIAFAFAMDFKSLTDKVVFDPPFDVKTHSFYSPYNNILSIYGLANSTRYTVHILPGMRDPYGNAIQTEKVITFTTQPARPSASLLMPYQPIYRVDGPQDFYLQYTNVDTVTSTLYTMTTSQFAGMMSQSGGKATYTTDDLEKVWQDIQKPEVKQDQRIVEDLTLTAGGHPLAPGFYFLGMTASPVEYKSPFLDSRVLIVSSDNITLKVSPDQILAWVTGLKTGQPVVGAHVSFLDNNFKPVANGVTDANGLVQVSLDAGSTASKGGNSGYYNSFYYALLDEPQHFALASSLWGSGASSTSFGPDTQYYRPWTATTSYVYTERPLYRPGQPVYFKGIVRNDDDLDYSLPAQKQVQVTIRSFKEQVYQETLPLSDIGTFDSTFQLDPEAALGSYSLQVSWPGSTQNSPNLGSVSFDVADYRRPEFQMDVHTDPANVLPGDAFNAALAASYYSGGGLSDADVDWSLRSEPYTFTPPSEYGAYSFSNAEYDNWNYYASRRQSDHSGLIATGQAKTGPDGKLTLPLKAQPASTQASQTLIFEATLTDFSGSSVSGQASVVMHTSSVYPGIRSKTYVARVDQDHAFELVALDWAGQPLAGAKVSVQIVERKWFSVQQEDDAGQLTWKTTVQENPVASFKDVVLDAKGLGSVSFRPSKGGIYRAIITAVDAHGNQNQSSAFVWVAGPDYVPWLQTNDRSFQLVADRASYTPGDTAELLIASPFQGDAYALVTIERGTLRKSEVLHLTANSTVYHLPITPDMAPNVYVSVIVVKGVDATNPRPNFRVGMARLKVDTSQQTLKVTLTTSRDQAAPRDTLQYIVQTATLDGKPVAAEVSLALSDLAALSLKASTVPPLLDFFYAPRSLSVITAVAIVQNIEEYNANIADALKAADGSRAGSGGGKGSGYTGVMAVRQDFPDTAFWQAQVKTGADGKATVSVTLPDNLTTWRMDARAVTADTRVGQTTLDLLSSKPLLIRPQTPRFFITGDLVTLGAAVHNNTAQSLSVTVALDAAGVTLSDPKPQVVSIPANSQSYVTWTATVPPASTRVDLTFSAQGGGLSDATRPTLGSLDNQGIPVYRYETPETVGTAGVVSENGARAESIDLPPDMQVQTGQLKVELSPSLAAGMADGLTYLEEYPYESTEGTISRFLPNLRLGQALQAAGIRDAALEAGLKTQVNLALQKIYSRQNADGGWGWWGEMKSDTLTTAYAALGLAEASAAGYTVNPGTLSKALNYLRSNLKAFNTETPPEQLNRQAFVLYVLARSGAPEVSRTVQLYDLRQSMALYARAYLLSTLSRIDPKDARLKTLLSDLGSAAILSAAGTHWEEKTADYWNWNTDLRTTAIVLAALIETDPGDALSANAVRYLMVNRTSGRWHGTQETAWSLLALTDWVRATGELSPDYRYAAAFNGKQLAQGSASPATVREVKSLVVDVTQMLSGEANRLVFARDGSAGSLYYTAYLNLWLPVNQVKALDRGIVISRQYYRPGDLSHPVTEAQQGDVLLARLTVVAPNTLRYLLVTDPLPAGMEAVDPSLATSPQAAQPEGYDWTRIGTDGWGWWFFSHIELRDQQVVLSTDVLPPGTYVYTYLVRASTPGAFNVLPPTAQQSYFPDVYGRGAGSQFTIK